MTKIWVLIADSSHAEIVEVEGMGKTIHILKHFEHPKSRVKNIYLETDRAGRMTDRVGGQRHAIDSKSIPQENERHLFASELMEVLEKAHRSKKFDQFAIIAPPTFLGDLNHSMPKQLKSALLKEVNHDIITIPDPKKRHDLMCKYLDLWNH